MIQLRIAFFNTRKAYLDLQGSSTMSDSTKDVDIVVNAVADAGEDASIVFSVLDQVHPAEENVDEIDMLADKFEPELDHQKAQKAAAKDRFFRLLLEKILDSIKSDSGLNDAVVSCGRDLHGRKFRVPSLLIASFCPVFRSVAASNDADLHCVVVPDLDGADFE